jgi:site-specific recombinase XerD
LADLADEFDLSLRAANKSPATRQVYGQAVRQLAAFLTERGMPSQVANIHREHVEAFIAHLLDTRSAMTAKTRFGGLQVFFRWLVEDGEVDRSPMERMRPPKVPQKDTAVVSDDDLRQLLRVCERDRTLAGRRDTALLRLYIDTGARLSEVADLTLDDLDIEHGLIYVRGKGDKYRVCPFGAKTALAVRRYLRERARHPLAPGPWLWLGKITGKRFGTDGVRQMVTRRAVEAGIGHVHPHQLRHTFAHQWLASGGQETDLMRLAGWSDRRMLSRYGQSLAAERARDAHRRLALGDRL